MAVMINTAELKETLSLTPTNQNIMLVGKHGIGKSEILTEHFKKEGMKVVTLFLALLELLKLGETHIEQEGVYGEIVLYPGRRKDTEETE